MVASVQLANVTKIFGDQKAVKELSLTVQEGEFLTLLGPSGCGKTTTLRIISGFEVPDEGLVYIDGTIVNHVPPFRRNVNTVFQNYALFPNMTVFENVAYGPTVQRVAKAHLAKRVQEMLDRVGLIDKAKNMPYELSGGEMQRVALVRALINEPRILLLDEPLAALDAKLRIAMRLELKHMHQKLGITFIFVTHDQEEALVMSDRIGVMRAGQMFQLGTPHEVFEYPNSRFVAEFIGSGNQLHGIVADRDASRGKVRLSERLQWEASNMPPSLHTGTPVTIVVRPQKIGVYRDQLPSRPASTNIVHATLKETVYAGSTVRFFVDLGEGKTLLAENIPENLAFDYRAMRTGDTMTLYVPSNAILLYPDDKYS